MNCEEKDKRVMIIKSKRKGHVIGKSPFPSGMKYIIKLDGNNGIRHKLEEEIQFLDK